MDQIYAFFWFKEIIFTFFPTIFVLYKSFHQILVVF